MMSRLEVLSRTMESDEEDMHLQRLRRFSGGLYSCSIPVVYDIRGKNTVVKGKRQDIKRRHIHYESLGKYFAVKYGVQEDQVYVDTTDTHVVIRDKTEDSVIVFIAFNEPHDEYHGVSIGTVGCLGIDRHTSVGDLKALICQEKQFPPRKCLCLFYKDQRFNDDAFTLASRVKNGDRISCVLKRKQIVQCFHLPRPNIENKYSISCFNTDTAAEMKMIFKKTFCDEFPGLVSGDEVVWFSQGRHVVKDDEFLYIDARKRSKFDERGRLIVHIKPDDSVPIVIKISNSGKDNTSHIIFTKIPVTVTEFRQEASVYTDLPPNALQLYLNENKVRKPLLSRDIGFSPNCTVTVKTTKRTSFHVKVLDGKVTKKLKIMAYKLDLVQNMKQLISEHLECDVRDMQMTFQGNKMKDEYSLQEYRITSEDEIHVRIFQDTIHLIVRSPGKDPFYLTVNEHRKCTVHQLKRFLVHKCMGVAFQNVSSFNVIFQDQCLQDTNTLEDCGLMSGSTILLPRATRRGEAEKCGIKTVFFSSLDGTFAPNLAVQLGGIMFYAPETIPMDTLKAKLTENTWPPEPLPEGMMIRKVPDGRLFPHRSKPTTVSQTEVVRYDPMHITGASTSKPGFLAVDRSVPGSNDVGQGKRLKYSSSQPILPGYHSDPEFNTLKRFTYCKELAEGQGRYFLREQSFYEEEVSKKHADERFASSSPTARLHSPDSTDPCQQESLHKSPSLIFPAEVVPNSILIAVSLEIGLDWKRLALILGLNSTDIESLEYSHSRSLHDQAFQALILWKKRDSKNATVTRLKEALRECGLALIADSIDEHVKYETT